MAAKHLDEIYWNVATKHYKIINNILDMNEHLKQDDYLITKVVSRYF